MSSVVGRHPLEKQRMVALTETALEVVGEQRAFMSKEQRLVRHLRDCEKADELELAMAQADYEEAFNRMKHAATAVRNLVKSNAAKRALYQTIASDFNAQQVLLTEQAQRLSKEATAVGFPYARPEMLVVGDDVEIG